MTSSTPALSERLPSFNVFEKDDDDSCGGIPEMILSSSLQSFPESDESEDSLYFNSSSPRSIFGSYWSSPSRAKHGVKSLEATDDEDDAAMAGLETLRLPFEDDDEDSTSGADVTNKIVHAPIFDLPGVGRTRKGSFDDDSVDYQAALNPEGVVSPMRTPRRQILPTPPPPTAVSSSLIMPRRQPHFLLNPLGGRGKSLSSSALLQAGPRRSCLRKTRYSCSAIMTDRDAAIVTDRDAAATGRLHSGLRNQGCQDLTGGESKSDLRDELKKSVSFYSQVSVFEFAVPREQQRSQEGWSKQFF